METGRSAQTADNTRTISLTVTQRCNLACIYCYEHNKSAADMTFETAKRILDAELRTGAPKENTYLEFFGGEPFLNFALMREVYDYVRSFYRGKLRFHTCTNGTLVHGEVQAWLKAHPDFSVGLSADGTQYAHDLNRSGSFDQIDFDFFLQNYAHQPVKMTVSALSLPCLAESVIYLSEKGFDVSCNLAYGIDWSAEENKTVLEEQLEALIAYYLERPQAKRCKLLDFSIGVLARPAAEGGTVRKYCGTGTSMVCYSVEGEAYPCQFFTPLSAGERALPLSEAHFTRDIDRALLPEDCRSCYFLRICPRCMGSNYLATGDLYRPDGSYCALHKLIFKANAKLKALEWERGMLALSPDEEQALLRSITTIQTL